MITKEEEKLLNALSQRISHLRKTKGFTQEKLAAEASMDRVAIANIETGKRRPTVTTIFRISKALKVKPGDFFDNL